MDRWITAIASQGWFTGDLAEILPTGDGWQGIVKYEVLELKEWVEVYHYIVRPVYGEPYLLPVEFRVWDYFPQVHEKQVSSIEEIDAPITQLLHSDNRTSRRVAFSYSPTDPYQHYYELPAGVRPYLQDRRFILSSSFAEYDLLTITDLLIDNDEVIRGVDYFFILARPLHDDACGVKWMLIELMRERKDALDNIVVPTDVIVPANFRCSVVMSPELGSGAFLPFNMFPRYIACIAKLNNEFLQSFPVLSFAQLNRTNPSQEALSIYTSSTFMRSWSIPSDFHFADKLSSTIMRSEDIPACVFDYGQDVRFVRIESSEKVKRSETLPPDYVFNLVVEVKLEYIYSTISNRIVFPHRLIVPYFFPAKQLSVKLSALGAVSVNLKPFEYRFTHYHADSPPFTYRATVTPQFGFQDMPPWEDDYFVGGEFVKWLSLIGTPSS